VTAVVDLAALPPTLIVPSLLHWLGIDQPEDEPEPDEDDIPTPPYDLPEGDWR
jgi:hypothetical protein